MQTTSKRGPKVIIDDESIAIINQGASLVQLAEMFGKDSRDVRKKLLAGNVKVAGERRGYQVYAVKDAAPYLTTPAYDIDEFIERMSYADLPFLTRKEFWAGMRSRQLYEREAGELWATSEVVDMVSELFKTLRLSLLLTRESVERETTLSERQREIIVHIIDSTLEDIHARIVKECGKNRRISNQQEPASENDDSSQEL